MEQKVTINEEQRLYMIKESCGFTMHGFERVETLIGRMEKWLNRKTGNTSIPGTVERYAYYRYLVTACQDRHAISGEKCPAELTPELIGLEGKRVEVTSKEGEKRRFYVGRSTGFIPCHIERKRADSSGGVGACILPGDTIKVIR